MAKEYGNQEIGQTHLLYALVTANEGLIPQLLKKMGINLDGLQEAVQAEIARAPKVSGGEQFLSSRFPTRWTRRRSRRRRWGTAMSPSSICFSA